MSVGHALKHVDEIGVRFDAIEFGRFHRRANDRPSFAAAIASREQVILATESHGADCAFDQIGLEFDAAVVQKARQFFPTRERVADRFGQRAAAGYARQLCFELRAQTVDDRSGERPPFGETMGGRLAAHARFNKIEFADPTQRFRRHGRAGSFGDFVELAPRMGPTGREHDVPIGGQSLKACIAVDVQHALEALQMRGRTFAPAIRREQINRRRRFRSAPWPLFTGIDPESPRFRAPSARIEHRNRRVVGEQMVACEHGLAQPIVQRLQPPASAADPSGQRRTTEIDTVSGEDLRLSTERRVIAIFGDQHLREQPRRRQSASDRPLRCRRLGDRAAGAAGAFRTQNALDAKLRWNPIQHLAHALADRMQRAAAICASLAVDVEADILAGQMIGQRLASGRRLSRLCFLGRTALADARNIAVEIFEGEAI